LAGRGIVEVVTRDAVDGRGGTGDDRQVVRIREARHDGPGDAVDAVPAEPRDGGRRVSGDSSLEIFGLGPVDADDDHRTIRSVIAAAVDGDGGGVHGPTDTTAQRPLRKAGFRLGSRLAATPERPDLGGGASRVVPTPRRGRRAGW